MMGHDTSGGKKMKHLFQEAQAMESELIAHRRYLHSHAETGFDLQKTVAYVQKMLTELISSATGVPTNKIKIVGYG